MPTVVTVSVANMLQGTKPEDIVDHFVAHLGDCKPIIGPIIAYEKRREGHTSQRRLSTTVSFQASGDWQTKLHGSKLYPSLKQVGYSRITVGNNFAGVTYLKEIPSHDFDVFFVHGLGGHAFNTWSSRKKDDILMWPRDLLPDSMKTKRLYGRYSTVGYESKPFEEATITSAAESLLRSLDEGRARGDKRPIFFVCHSLGGLVVCRALGLTLYKTKREHEVYKQLFLTDNGECLVKGVAFFGTPFQGSRLADFASYAASLQKALTKRKSLVAELKSNTKELNDIVGVFKQLRNEHDIGVRIYYEKRRLPFLNLSFLVTRPLSAIGFFSRFDPTGLNANHRTMVKFTDGKDADYRLVEGQLAELVGDALQSQIRDNSIMQSKERQTISDDTHSIAASVSSGNTIHSSVSDLSEAGEPIRNEGESHRPIRPQIGDSAGTNRFLNLPLQSRHRRQLSLTRPRGPMLTPLMIYNSTDNIVIRQPDPTTPTEAAAIKDAGALLPLRDYDTVFILDDTSSMGIEDTEVNGVSMSRWECLLSSIQYFGDIVARMDDDGIDVRFLINREKDMSNIRNGRDLLRILDGIKLYHRRFRHSNASKESCLNAVLRSVINDYMLRLRQRSYDIEDNKTPARLKKLNLIVITAGDLDEYEEIERTLVTTARDLRFHKAASDQVGVQFVHVGQDKKASKWLQTLDDHLKQMYGIRDIVDTRTFDAGANYDDVTLQRKIRQILLGGVNRDIDNEEDV